MDQNERMRLQKQYEHYADGQILAMLGDGADAFVEGAYGLLEDEARRRGLSLDPRGQESVLKDPQLQGASAHGIDTQPAALVEIIVINDDADKKTVAALLEQTDIPYNFLNISVRGKELPVALMVDEERIDEAIKHMQQVPLSGSIVLW
jgi:hypothetical protein